MHLLAMLLVCLKLAGLVLLIIFVLASVVGICACVLAGWVDASLERERDARDGGAAAAKSEGSRQ